MLKKWSAVFLAIALIFTLAACGSGNSADNGGGKEGDGNSNNPATSDSGGGKSEKVTLKIIHWQQENINNAIEAINKKFEDTYPNVKVEYITAPPDATYDQLMQTRMNATDTDILALKTSFIGVPEEWSPGAQDPLWKQWIDAGLIADLTGQSFLNHYNPGDVEQAMTYKGKVYGVNMGKVAFTGLFYNKDMFAKYDLKVPTTWDELLNVFQVLKDNGVAPLGMAGKDVWPMNLAVEGLQASIIKDQAAFIKGLWTGETKFTDPVAIEVLEKSQVLMNNTINGFMGIDYGTLPSVFASEQVAMIADGTWNAPLIASLEPGFEFGYFPIPGSNDAAQNSQLAGKYDMTWLVLEKSAKKEYALKWLEMISDPANYTDFVNAAGFIPTQPNIQLESKFTSELEPYLTEFKLAWEILFINRQNVGEYAKDARVHAEYLAPAGPIKDPAELAGKSQTDWDAAAPK